jgi:WD40 repeat protein
MPLDLESLGAAALSFSADGKRLAASGSSEIVYWDLSTEQPKKCLTLTHPDIRSSFVQFSPDGKTFVSNHQKADEGRAVQLWNLSGGKVRPAATLTGLKDIGVGAMFSRDGKALAVAPIGKGRDPTIKLWDLGVSPPAFRAAIPHFGFTWSASMAFSPDGRTLATTGERPGHKGEERGGVELWDLTARPPRQRALLLGHSVDHDNAGTTAVAYSPDGKTLASGGTDGIIRLWDVSGSKPAPRALAPGYSIRVRDITFAPAGTALAVSEADGSGRVLEKDRGLFIERARLPRARTVAFAPDGVTLAAAEGRSARLWRLEEGRLREHGLLTAPGVITRLSFSGDGAALAVGGDTGKVVLWRLTGRQQVLTGPPSAVASMVLSADGATLTVVHANHRVVLWDTARGTQLGSAQPPEGTGVLDCLPGGATVVTSDLRLWQLVRDKLVERGRLGKEADYAQSAAFGPGGRVLASAGWGQLAVWDVVGSKKLHQWRLPAGPHRVTFTHDGKYLATANANGTGYLLRLAP